MNDTPIHDNVNPDTQPKQVEEGFGDRDAEIKADADSEFAVADPQPDVPRTKLDTRDSDGFHAVWGTDTDGPYAQNFATREEAETHIANRENGDVFPGSV